MRRILHAWYQKVHFSEQKPAESQTDQKPADQQNEKPVDQQPTEQNAQQNPPPVDNGGELDFDKLDTKTQAYIRSLRDENAKHRRDKQAAKDQADEAERKRLEAAGEWQKVAQAAQTERDEFKPFKEKYEALEDLLGKQVAKRIKELPEQFRKLVPEKYTVIEKWEWLEANTAAFQVKTAPNLDAGAGKNKAPGAQDTPNEAHLKDVAQRFRLRMG